MPESSGEATLIFRLIITRRNASEILVMPAGSGWMLPQVEIRPHGRSAEQLTGEAARVWGFQAYCLFVPEYPTTDPNRNARYAFMESAWHNDTALAGTCWMRSSAAARCCGSPDADVIERSFVELRCYTKSENARPFARPGWLRELFRWAQDQVGCLGLRLNGRFRQLTAGPAFTLIRLEAEGAAVWFKATGAPNSHELTISVTLARLFPRYVPHILGVHRQWNGWLSAEAEGISLCQGASFSEWERAAESLALLQIDSIGKTDQLLDANVKDIRIACLADRIDAFIAQMSETMAAQEKPAPPPLADSELAVLSEELKEACGILETLGLPDTLGHMDFNPGNIVLSGNRCVFLDWAEGCVTNPVLTFEYLREHMRRIGIEQRAACERLTASYLRPWASLYCLDSLKQALTFSPLIAAFAHAVASDTWRSPNLIRDPQLAGYYRSLTRRMYREAIRAAERCERCLD